MPFDPRLIQPDDAPLLPDGEIDLPADLAALGEQLRDDALHLAVRFPATGDSRGELAALTPASRARSWQKIAVLAASGLASVLAGVFAVQMIGQPSVDSPIAAQPVAPRDNSREPAGGAPPATIPASSSTTVSLTDLSGPELEALLDLWQREPNRADSAGVSF